MFLKSALADLSALNITAIRKAHLKELDPLSIDLNTPIEQRFNTFLNKINNPYCFLVDGTPVQVSFTSKHKTLDSSLYNYLIDKKNLENDLT